MNYQIAFQMESGEWDIVEDFDETDDDAANKYAESEYPDREWYVLRNGKNINGEID